MGAQRRRPSLPAPRAIALALVACSAPALALPQGGGDDQKELFAFQIYDTQAARALATSAEEHFAARRWSEGLVELQTLIEEHAGDVLAGAKPTPRDGDRPSEHWVHEGAAAWATRRLFELGPEARELYIERHDDRAARAFAAAIESGDRAGLTVLARRWPITRHALRAWWALGDLELELGNESDAFRAWGRGLSRVLGDSGASYTRPADWRAAIDALGKAVEDDTNGWADELTSMRSRVDHVVYRLGAVGDSVGKAYTPRDVTALTPQGDFGRPLGGETDGWPTPYVLPPHPFQRNAAQYRIFPTRLGDTVFINTSRELIAVGAYTGEEMWRNGEQLLGWDRISSSEKNSFQDAIDLDEIIVAPAADQGVVVCVLQIPHAFEEDDVYGDLQIIKRIPERRLFAFDVQTGDVLWHTLPPPMWDGESGSFAQRMTVVGPPVIAGSRVFVPAAQLRGRIEFHVGCFDLFTGDTLWSTPLITGQRGLNMFGRSMSEFSAPPLVVAGNRVIALTQLGVLAGLDLFTGETLWETLYSQIPIDLSQYYSPSKLRSVWSNAPPVVTGDTIVATPMDSRFAVGVDIETGAVIWSKRHDTFVRGVRGGGGTYTGGGTNSLVRVLLGADERRVYLGGSRISAFESLGGIDLGAPTRRKWVWPVDDALVAHLPRAVLGGDRLYVPRRAELVVLDQKTGVKIDSMPWLTTPGNVLLGDGVLFTLNAYRLSGYFEWQAMVDRAKALVRESPEDVTRARDLSLLLLKRGISEMLKRDYKGAADHLTGARRALEKHIAEGETNIDPILRSTLHEVLRQEARNLRWRADSATALRRLARAHELATTPQDRLDTLLVTQAVLRNRDLKRWRTTLEEIATVYADMELLCEAERAEDGPQSWRGSIAPVVAQLASESSMPKLVLPVGLWVLLERVQSWTSARGPERHAAEFADLHQILAEYSGVDVLGMRAGEWASARIGAKLAKGEHAGYDRFESRAEETLARALDEGDIDLLERIPQLYPYSSAAERSNDKRLELSLASGDVEVVADIVLGDLPLTWSAKTASERDLLHLVRLAEVLGEEGNLELRAGLTKNLARHAPRLTPEVASDTSRTLRQLAEEWALPPLPPPASTTARFGREPRAQRHFAGAFRYLGEIPPDASGQTEHEHVVLFADRMRLYAFSNTGGQEPVWRDFLSVQDDIEDEPDDRAAFTRGRAHLASARRVLTLDRETGEELWSWSSRSKGLVRLAASDGVVVAVERTGGGNARTGPHRLVGLDAVSGIELWRLNFETGLKYWLYPVLGDGRLVLVPRGQTRDHARVFDLFTGRLAASFRTGPHSLYNVRAAWIQDGRIVLPQFRRSTRPPLNYAEAFELEDGDEAWRIEFNDFRGGRRELTQVVRHEGTPYLMLRSGLNADEETGVYGLNVKLGALDSTPKVVLKDGDRAVGLRDSRRIDLAGPLMFVLAEAAVGDLYTLKAFDLRVGGTARWQANLPHTFTRTSAGEMPLPAVSDSSVAVAYRQRDNIKHALKTELVFFDRDTGERIDARTLPKEMSKTSGRVHFVSLGEALIVSGAMQMDFMR
ncbi:MAG: PQQ-binding-like beta-propeller repeat protein [bacterium]|nr:PQQ-binding-like beta-propeller repeat protein [bacterium]